MNDDERLFGIVDLRTLRFLSWLSGVFCVIVIAGLGWYALQYQAPAYFDEAEFLAPREQLQQSPKSEALQRDFRREDLERRRAYVASRRKLSIGAWLLLGGAVVFLLSRRGIVRLRGITPRPLARERVREPEREQALSAVAVIALSVLVGGATFGGIALLRRKPAPPEQPPEPPLVVEAPPEQTDVPKELRWHQFRGPTGMGTVPARPFPRTWDAAAGKNILWKVKVPMHGNSSPVVWGDRIFVTGADRAARKIFCYERATGKLLWETTIKTEATLGEDFQEYEDTGLAAPTVTTDGVRIYAFFGTAELAAVDFNGRQIWSRWFGKPESVYGLATSPMLYDGMLYLQLDQSGPHAGKSFLYAIDPKTGKDTWKVPREVGNSWSSPVVAETEQGEVLITAGNPWTIAYDAEMGAELWRARVLMGDVAPLPVYADGLFFVTTEYAVLAAIRAGGDGDVTDTHVVWQHYDDLPDVASPVTDGKLLLIANGGGYVTCLEAKTGKVKWLKELESGFWSSPTLVGRTVYLTDKQGRTLLFPLAEKFELQSTGTLGETVVTTPAFVGDKIYIRGRTHLFAIGKE